MTLKPSFMIQRLLPKAEGGLGDFLRGTIALFDYCQGEKIPLAVDISQHPISKYTKLSIIQTGEVKQTGEEVKKYDEPVLHCHAIQYVQEYIKQDKHIVHCTGWPQNCGKEIHPQPISTDSINFLQSLLQPNDFMEEKLSQQMTLMGNRPYIGVHFRCGDGPMMFKHETDPNLIEEAAQILKKLQMFVYFCSDSGELMENVRKLNMPHVFVSPCKSPVNIHRHMVKEQDAFDTMFDVFMLTRSCHVTSYSVYDWGSGFVEWPCLILTTPYSIELRDKKNMSTIIDIFYKTYQNDYEWLKYSLLSCAKFAQNFRRVVVVSDDISDLVTWDLTQFAPLEIKFIHVPLPPGKSGYIWQQVIKCTWFNYTDADMVYSMDSDCLFTDEVDANELIDPITHKCIWYYRDFEPRVADWRNILVKTYPNHIPELRETMCLPNFLLSKKLVTDFQQYIQNQFHQSIEDYFFSVKERVSEYNMLGNYGKLFHSEEYDFKPFNTYNHQTSRIKQFWSYSTVTPIIATMMNDIIAGDWRIPVNPTDICDEIVLLTTLCPNADENQKVAIKSWLDRNIKIISVNAPEELTIIKKDPLYTHPNLTLIEEPVQPIYGNLYMTLDGFAKIANQYLEEHPDSTIFTLNAAIILGQPSQTNDEVYRMLWKIYLKSKRIPLQIGRRRNFDTDITKFKTEMNGIDIFIGNKTFWNNFPQTNFRIGQCWWDWFMVRHAISKHQTINEIDDDMFYHKNHTLRWSSTSWNYFEKQYTDIFGKENILQVFKDNCINYYPIENVKVNNLALAQKYKIDLFYKSYAKDYEWLQYSLRSCAKFAKNFREVIVISDDIAELTKWDLKQFEPLRIKFIQVSLPNGSSGYVWQQVIKCTWFNYSNADIVYIMDSDSLFTEEMDATSLFDRSDDNKLTWYIRDWQNEVMVWRPVLEHTYPDKKLELKETMCRQGFPLTRKLVLDFQQYIKNKFNQSIQDYFLSSKHKVSEYNLLGNWALLYSTRNEYKFIDYNKSDKTDVSIKQFWSYSGVTPKIKVKMEDILAGDFRRVPKENRNQILDKIVFITSLCPGTHINQENAVKSWMSRGIKVISINCAEEISRIKTNDLYLHPNIKLIEKHIEPIFGKSYCPLNLIVEEANRYLKSRSDHCVFLINSDIILGSNNKTNDQVYDVLWQIYRKSERVMLQLGKRRNFDVDMNKYEIEPHGNDVFIGRQQFWKEIPNTNYRIGQCFFDYFLPRHVIAKNGIVMEVDSNLFMHKIHPVRWSSESWNWFKQEYTSQFGNENFQEVLNRACTNCSKPGEVEIESDATLQALSSTVGSSSIGTSDGAILALYLLLAFIIFAFVVLFFVIAIKKWPEKLDKIVSTPRNLLQWK